MTHTLNQVEEKVSGQLWYIKTDTQAAEFPMRGGARTGFILATQQTASQVILTQDAKLVIKPCDALL